MEMCRTHQISDTTGNVMCPSLEMYMKYEISDVTGYIQEMYSKCHVSLTWEMCRTHQLSDTTGNVMCPCLGIVPDM